MNVFFKNIGLYAHSKVNVNIGSAELTERLQKITYKTNTTFISLEKDTTIPTRFEYRGMIKKNSFIIKRRMRLFDLNINNPVFHGDISDVNGQSSVSIDIHPSRFQMFNWFIILCFCFVAVFFNIRNNHADLIFPAITSGMAIIQYFILKRGISRGKYEFERELIYIAQKP